MKGRRDENGSKSDVPEVSSKPQQSKSENTTVGSEKKEDTSKTLQSTEKTVGQKVSEAIAKLYVQKSIYLNKLDAVEAEVRGIFLDTAKQEKEKGDYLDKAEQKGVKNRLLTEYLPKVAAWETECDNMVYGILDEIKAALKKSGGDTSIVTKLEESYLNEKKTKKSYFINRYMD